MPVGTSMAILAGTALASTATAGYFGVSQLGAARAARRKQESLEEQRRRELANEAAARDAAARRAATSGRRVGRTSLTVGRLGLGSGDTPTGLGMGSLFGN